MTTIELITTIKAPVSYCFDLSRSVTLHMISTRHTHETVVSGKQDGLFEKGDIVTWRARHFGIYQQLTMQITQMEYPVYFEDIMLKGIFKSIRHQHFFAEENGQTVLKDIFQYETPFSFVGNCFDYLVLKHYMTRLLLKRNETIKTWAEDSRQGLLPGPHRF